MGVRDGEASPTAMLADHLSALTLDAVPPQVRHEAKRVLLDTLGCLAAGARTEVGPIARSLGALYGNGDAVTVPGAPGRMSLLGGLYANGRIANAMDFDETFPVGAHFGVAAVTTALALAERDGLSGAETLLALVAGYELGGRVASWIGPVAQVEGDRVTGFPLVWGVAAPVAMAAAGAASRALGLGPALFAEAIGLAGSNAPLPAGAQWSNAVDLPNCKYCDAGWCAVAGAFGALSAAAGSTGFPRILDGAQGLASMCGVAHADASLLIDRLGSRWMLSDVTYKPWPTCRFTHYPLTALARLLAAEPIPPEAIEEIVIESGPLALSGRFTNPAPRTFASRQFSYPHMVAMLVLGYPAGPDWLDPAVAEAPAVAAMKAKVRVEPHPRGDSFAADFERNQIRTMPGGVRLRAGGKALHAETDFALGDPWTPETRLDDAALAAKFRRLVGHGAADRAIEAVLRLEALDDVEPLLAVLRAPAAGASAARAAA